MHLNQINYYHRRKRGRKLIEITLLVRDTPIKRHIPLPFVFIRQKRAYDYNESKELIITFPLN